MTPKVSVIIPVYNTEPYLKRCLDSVCNQTLKDIEIICVNDGSTDNSLEILQGYEKVDGRIKVVDFERNKGVSIARNTGIDAAQGEYIGFVDSDDYIDLDFYEKLYEKAIENDADIVKGNMVVTDSFSSVKTITTLCNEEIRKSKYCFNVNFSTAIYKKKLLEKYTINFPPEIIYGEERAFPLKAAIFANKLEVLDDTYYHYIKNENPNSADVDFLTEPKVNSYLEVIKSIIILANSTQLRQEDYVYITAFFLQEIIRIFAISINQTREKILCCLFELFQVLKAEYRNDFREKFYQKDRKVSDYLFNNDTVGLLNYLMDRQTQDNIYFYKRFNSLSDDSKQIIPVFLSSDDNYAPFVATTIVSICCHTKAFMKFYILDGGISEFNKKQITLLKDKFDFSIEFIKVNIVEIFQGFHAKSHITISTYNRFLIPQIKPHLGKVIYLDVDVIALGNIAELYNEDLMGYSLAAVPETASKADSAKWKKNLDIPAEHIYFNAGVLLIDVQKWRENKITKKLFAIEKEYRPKLSWGDQDVLNKCFELDYRILDNKYNYMTGGSRVKVSDMVIRHFNTIWKPWQTDKWGPHEDKVIKNYNEFWFFACQTPFLIQLQQQGISGKTTDGNDIKKSDILQKPRQNVMLTSKENFLVSIVIPVYNTENYLRQCLDSVLGQTHDNLEIICVNDCSSDNSATILTEYTQKDKRIKTITHEENKGPGNARNSGLRAAKGDYVYFLDSDDWLDCNYIGFMLNAAESKTAEVVLNTNIVASDGSQFQSHFIPDKTNCFISSKNNIGKVIWNVWAHL
jgi:glycosyltransferase involved in cell wall biosynthesis